MYVLLMSLVLLSTLRFLIKLIDFFLPLVKLLTVRIDVPKTTRDTISGGEKNQSRRNPLCGEVVVFRTVPFAESILHKKNSSLKRYITWTKQTFCKDQGLDRKQ